MSKMPQTNLCKKDNAVKHKEFGRRILTLSDLCHSKFDHRIERISLHFILDNPLMKKLFRLSEYRLYRKVMKVMIID